VARARRFRTVIRIRCVYTTPVVEAFVFCLYNPATPRRVRREICACDAGRVPRPRVVRAAVRTCAALRARARGRRGPGGAGRGVRGASLSQLSSFIISGANLRKRSQVLYYFLV
jgi:hypothetical protein